MKRLFTVIALPLLATGCWVPTAEDYRAGREDSILQQYSAGHTGCVPVENAISNRTELSRGYMWNASCKNRTYLCTNLSRSEKSSETNCAPAQ